MMLARHSEPGRGGGKVEVLSQRDIAEKIDGKQARATTVEVTLDPGQASAPHRHPGPVFGYVIEGEYEWAIDDRPVKKLKAGDTFYEPTGCLHRLPAPGVEEPRHEGQDSRAGRRAAPPRRQGPRSPGEGEEEGMTGRVRSASSRSGVSARRAQRSGREADLRIDCLSRRR
jgi:quercetin dioxygenase-like cupin family protein